MLLGSADTTWRQRLSGPGQWLAGTAWTTLSGGVAQLVSQVGRGRPLPRSRALHPPLPPQFNASFRGVVLYDPAIYPTALLASTSAGAEDLLPVSFRPSDPSSLYSRLVAGGPRLPVVRSLVGAFNGNRTGSVKRDAYTWAVDTYIRGGLVDAATLVRPSVGGASRILSCLLFHLQGYYIDYYWTTRGDVPGPYDKVTLANHDWVVAQRGFFFDLSPWSDAAPDDDPHQPLGSDRAAFEYMLAAAYAQVRAQGGGGAWLGTLPPSSPLHGRPRTARRRPRSASTASRPGRTSTSPLTGRTRASRLSGRRRSSRRRTTPTLVGAGARG